MSISQRPSEASSATTSLITASPTPSLRAFRLAAGLLLHDRGSLPVLYLACIAPRLFLTLGSPSDGFTLFLARAAEHLIELLVLAAISIRILNRLSSEPAGRTPGRSPATLFLFCAVGMLSWLTLLCPSDIVPFEILWTVGSPGGIGPALFMALPSGFIWYLHFFWSFALLLTPLTLPTRINLCRYFTQQDPWAPVKAVLGPTALMYLPTLLVLAPYPDGRSLELSLLADALSGIQWILCSYVSLAIGLSALPEALWRELKLDPYRASRFSTLELQGPGWLASALSPKTACQLLGLCTLVWGANLARLAQLPPSPTLSLTRAWTDAERHVHVDLQAEDDSFYFRGFRPLQFRLTDEGGTEIKSPFPDRATIDGAAQDVRVFFPERREKISLQLTFSLQARADASPQENLENLQLWYGGTKIARVRPEQPEAKVP
jgi:hypothetical protein